MNLKSAEIAQDSSLASQPVIIEEKTAVELTDPWLEEDFNELEVKVYPNPSKGAVYLEINRIPEGEQPEIEIWSPSGELISKSVINGLITRINLWGKPGGIYFVRTTLGGQIFNWKIIKE